jgi:AcrR family transcriptional regulator
MSQPQYRARGISAGLTLDDVIDAAAGHIAKDGVETLTMRRLATRLKVTPMAIYRHVANKHALLSLVADRYLDELEEPADRSDWRAYLEQWFDALHELMLEQPVLSQVIVKQPLHGAVGWKLADHAFAVLEEHGFGPRAAGSVFTAGLTYTIGFSLVGLARESEPDPTVEEPSDEERAAFPHLASAIEHYAAWLGESTFQTGLRTLIRGWPGPGAATGT